MKTFAPFRFVLRLNKSDYMSSRSDSPPLILISEGETPSGDASWGSIGEPQWHRRHAEWPKGVRLRQRCG